MWPASGGGNAPANHDIERTPSFWVALLVDNPRPKRQSTNALFSILTVRRIAAPPPPPPVQATLSTSTKEDSICFEKCPFWRSLTKKCRLPCRGPYEWPPRSRPCAARSSPSLSSMPHGVSPDISWLRFWRTLAVRQLAKRRNSAVHFRPSKNWQPSPLWRTSSALLVR